jgi:hypothetical protein
MDLADGMDYEVGGDWTAEWRHLHVATGGWLRGGDIPTRLYNVKTKALLADSSPSTGNIEALRHSLSKLELAIEQHQARLTKLHLDVGHLIAAALRERDESKTQLVGPDWADQATRLYE